jgi:hypothetical protein
LAVVCLYARELSVFVEKLSVEFFDKFFLIHVDVLADLLINKLAFVVDHIS